MNRLAMPIDRPAVPTAPACGGDLPDLRETAGSARVRRASVASHASGRRRSVDPTTCERDDTAHVMEFMRAMQDYKEASGRMFPTWSETLEVLRALGYRKA